jgi:hypothetical protein
MNGRKTAENAIDHGAAFIALATVLMALWGIPALVARGHEPLGYLLTGILALACVGVLYDRLDRLNAR